MFIRSPPHSECQRDHPRRDASRTGILICRLYEESGVAHKGKIESRTRISSHASTSDVTEDYVCLNQGGEKEETKKRIEDIDGCQGGLRELNGSAVVADGAGEVWVQPADGMEPELGIDRQRPEVRVGGGDVRFLQNQRLDAETVIGELQIGFEVPCKPIPAADGYMPSIV